MGGPDEQGSILREQVTAFPGKQQTALLMSIGLAQDWEEDEMDQFVESIH